MKRLRVIFLSLAVICCLPALVSANSGPVYWQGYPSSEVMVIQKDSPLIVKKEELLFDFSDTDDSYYTISGKVTAAYDMINPTDKIQSVEMAFPFVEALADLSLDDIVITADGNELPFKIYIGDKVDNRKYDRQADNSDIFDFSTIISTITDEPYRADNFDQDEKGKLYTIHIKPTTEQRINFAVSFNMDHENTKILTKGFNRYEREGEKARIAAWCYEPKTLEILVLGKDIEFNFAAYTDGDLSDKTNLYEYELYSQDVELKQHLMDYIKNNSDVNNDMISDIQLYNMYAEFLDKNLTQNMGICPEEDLSQAEHLERIFIMTYTLEFSSNSQRKVSVSYKTTGTMDMTQTATPLYTFDYILNPAKHWAEFQDLHIKIIPPQEAPYIVNSSIEFERSSNVYTATLTQLPEDDLSFTLYAKEKVSFIDKVEGIFKRSFGFFAYLSLMGLVIVTLIGISIFIMKQNG